MAPLGSLLAPGLLDLAGVRDVVQASALRFRRVISRYGSGLLVFFLSASALRSASDARTPTVLGVPGLFGTVTLASYTGGLQGTGGTRSPLPISLASQFVIPLGACSVIESAGTLDPLEFRLAILAAHVARSVLGVARFRQGRWRAIPGARPI